LPALHLGTEGGLAQRCSVKPEILADLDRVLKAAIAEQVAKPLAELRASFGELDGVGAELAARLSQASALGASGKETGPGGFQPPF